MIEEVVSTSLAVDEKLIIKKNVLKPEKLTGNEKRICIVTGTHGDELEGQYVCYKLNSIINENKDKLKGIVEIYPALNPLGIDSISRGIPMFDLDMNRIFPGGNDGAMAEYAAAKIIENIEGADMCIDIHASNIFLTEMPQIRINEQTADILLPYAKMMNIDFIWVHASATVLEATLAYSLNQRNVPTLVVEMGVGMRITKEYGDQLIDGILNLMKNMGIWDGDVKPQRKPMVSVDNNVGFINSNSSGIFIPNIKIFDKVKKDDIIGRIVDPLTGEVQEDLKAPCSGVVFTIREYPIVYSGSLISRILETGGDK